MTLTARLRLLTGSSAAASCGRYRRCLSRKKHRAVRSASSEQCDNVSDRWCHRFESCLRRQSMIIRTFSFHRIGSDYCFISDIQFLLKTITAPEKNAVMVFFIFIFLLVYNKGCRLWNRTWFLFLLLFQADLR